jgi:hypothetical protein
MSPRDDRSPEGQGVKVLIPIVVHGRNLPRALPSGTITGNYVCVCGKVVSVTMFVVGDPPFTARGVPCTCGQTTTVEFDCAPDPFYRP